MTNAKPVVAMLFCALLSFPAAAQELTGTLKKIKDSGSITIGHLKASIPFAYLDKNHQPIGYAIDLCMKVVDAVKAELKLPNLKVVLQPITSSDRIPLLQNNVIDMECGSTTNSLDRQRWVSFGPTYFVANVTAAVRKDSQISLMTDLNNKVISTASGTTSVPLLKGYSKTKNITVREVYGKSGPEAFDLMAKGEAAAFVMDDVLLASFIAHSDKPKDFQILVESLREEPYSMMFRKNDPQFKALVDRTITGVMKSGEIVKIYNKWFEKPIPPKGINLNFPMTQSIKDAFNNPNDKGV